MTHEWPEDTAAWTKQQYEGDDLGIVEDEEEGFWHYTNWPEQ